MEKLRKEYPEETRLRSLIKSLVYRILSITGTFIILWLVIGELKQTTLTTIYVQVFLSFLYYFHERIWNKIKWGKLWKE